MSEVLGNKADDPIWTPSDVAGVVSMLKGLMLLNRIVAGTVTTVTSTSDIRSTDLASYPTAAFAGQICYFTSGANVGVAIPITVFTTTTGRMQFSNPSLPAAASIGDTFVIIPAGLGWLLAPTIDTTATSLVSQTLGNKGDAAVAAVSSTASALAYLKGLVSGRTWTTDQDSSPTINNVTTEQDVITGGTATPGDQVVWGLSLANLAVASTIRVYMKLDAANWTEIEALRQSVSAGKSASGSFRFSTTGTSAAQGYKVTLQAAAPPGATQIYAQARRRTG